MIQLVKSILLLSIDRRSVVNRVIWTDKIYRSIQIKQIKGQLNKNKTIIKLPEQFSPYIVIVRRIW